MKVNGNYVVELLNKGNSFLIQHGKTFEVANFSVESKKTQDFGKESFLQDLSSDIEGIEFKRTRKEILSAILDSYNEETLDKLASALKESFSSSCYPVEKWFDLETRLSCDDKKENVAAMLLLNEVPDFITVDEVTKDKKHDKEYKELFAPIVALSKAFPKTGDASLHSITKAAVLKSEHEKIKKLAVVFSDFVKKGLFHCFRHFDVKEILKILEDDSINFPRITDGKKRDAIKFYSLYLSIMQKFLKEDKSTGFWKLQPELESKVTYFDVQIEDGNLLASPKIIKAASIAEDQDIPTKKTAEEKGKSNSVVDSNQSTEENPNGGFHKDFNLSKTKHEETIDKKCSQDLIDLLRKNGVPVEGDVDFKALFQFMSKKRAVSDDEKEDSKPAAKKQKDTNSEASKKSSKPPSKKTIGSATSKSSSNASSSSSKKANGSTTSKTTSSSSGSSDLPSTPVQTKKGKWFKKLKHSPSASNGKKYVCVNATIPFKNEFSNKFEVIFGITASNELNRGPDKHMFEWRASVFAKSLLVAYSTWEEDEFQFKIGSMSSLTEKLVSANQSVLRIRANPGSLNNDYLSFNTYAKYQTLLKMQLDVETIEEAKVEVPNLIQELQHILSSPDWFLCYQISCYWEFVSPEDTTDVDDVLQELWEKAAGSKEDPDFAFIKNGLQKVFKDTMGRARGGLYGSLVVDARNALRTDVGVNPIVSSLDLKFDEFLVDEDIAVCANQTFRQYSDKASVILFKQKFDDQFTREKIARDMKWSRLHRERRLVESQNPHHRIIDRCEARTAERVQSFREALIPRTSKFFFEKVYDLYLDFASFGQDEYFLEISKDPLLSTGKIESYKRLKSMNEEMEHLKKEIDQAIQISDETRKLFYTSSRMRQREILQMIIFEAKNVSLEQKKCSICRGLFTFNSLHENTRSKCNTCEKNKWTRRDVSKMFPVWFDKDNKPQYDLPEELQDLTVTEKMLIQTQSFLIPCIHIGKGKFGLCGHTVMFKRDIASICQFLPRSELDYIEVRKLSVNKDQQTFDTFKVRRKKVLAALKWLKEHNKFYKDITIVESNLDWMEDQEEATFKNFKENVTLSDTYNNSSVSQKQTCNPIAAETIEMTGIGLERPASLMPENAKELIDDFASLTENTKSESPILWPETDELPVDEFFEEESFAKCYPWLFPAGLGDISHEVKSERSKAIEWTKLLLSWEDGRFQHDACFTFHVFNFIQRHVNNGASLSLLNSMFSEHKTVEEIKEEIENGNFSTVGKIQNFAAEKIRGGDGWWRSRKHELDSWVAHHIERGHGPPTLFMTFSCAEYWWDDLLQFLKKRIVNTEDEHFIEELENGNEEVKRKIQATLVDKYCASVQKFFHERLDNWLETIGKNVFNMKYYYLRFEFAKGRGQIHAHMVAITTDLELLTEFHQVYCVQKKEELAASLMEEYVQNVLSLTEEYDIELDAMMQSEKSKSTESAAESSTSNPLKSADVAKSSKPNPLATTFASALNHGQDLCQLCKDVHMHDCLDYCLGSTTKDNKARTCRMGAGTEVTPNDPTSTPGFDTPKEVATIEKDYKKNIHILKLKRNHPRLKKTSTSMLESWRANCDVSVIIYATDPNDIVPADIARINGYITSYCTKGNLSYQEEKTSIASVITNYDYCPVRSEKSNMSAVLRKTMNSLLTSRIVSKPEASVELLGLDLYWCTESAKHINLTGLQQLLKKKKRMTDPIQKYKHRHKSQLHLSFVEYMKVLEKKNQIRDDGKQWLRQRDQKNKQRYLHPIGFNSSPVFPVRAHYAIATLVLHKKWDDKNRLDFESKEKSPEKEFHEFLRSDDCPNSVKLQYAIAKHKFERKLFGGCKEVRHNKDLGELDEEGTALYNLVCNASLTKSVYKNFYMGNDGYDFNRIHYEFDCDNSIGVNWLKETIEQTENEESMNKKTFINPNTNKPFAIEDIGDNEEQNEIVYRVLHKIKEWIEFPEKKKEDPTQKFDPLVLTVRGAGGTGKTFLVKVILNAIESMFDVKVTETCAPTGCAAYNIFGKTIHSLFCINVDDPSKELSPKQKDRIFQLLRTILVLVIDERSMLSLELLNAVSTNCSEFAHGTGNTEEIFGGIPVVLILGDDSQLPPVRQLGAFDTFQESGMENTLLTGSNLKGKHILDFTVQNVKSLKKIKRIAEGEHLLQELNQTLRTEPGLSKEQSLHLCKLNLDNPDITQERRKQIQEKALYVYTTKEEVSKHNEAELRKIVNKNNPLMEFSFQLEKTEWSKLDKPVKSHFKLNTLIEAKTVLARGARVSLTTNKWAHKGLFNGALGTVIDIRFDQGCSPLVGDFPLFVIVSFDNYIGPAYDERNPTYVPIPIQSLNENRSKNNHRCCKIKYVPLEIAFGRTLHKVQGQSIGPGHAVPIMVFNPGKTSFEGRNPGLLYTGISRATSLGANDVNRSAIYFNSSSKEELYTRVRDIHYKRKRNNTNKQKSIETQTSIGDFLEPMLTNEKYTKVKKRKYWTDYLDVREKETDISSTPTERREIELWLEQGQRHVQSDLYKIVQFHSKRYKTV